MNGLGLPVVALLWACTTLASPPRAPLPGEAFRNDRIWYDGLAEKCVYDATRTIYGEVRRYEATAYTNKENVDLATTAKSKTDQGVEMFKHHWAERVPTERYDYDFSTMSYTRVADMAAYKLTAATQEDCGASFKEVWRDGERLKWLDSVYFPDGGRREGTLKNGAAVFFDALTLRLRAYDFVQHPDLELLVIPMQKDTHRVSFEPLKRTVRFVKTGEIEVPLGKVAAHELALVDEQGQVEARYWFAVDGTAPMLHALVRFEGPQGITYALKSHQRTAYWKRD
ncbi:MAG: hypothetical protein JNL28_00955 [Planctomycetes bacterium]|nr:hypothetical protein [Planctomycetota bacterium]